MHPAPSTLETALLGLLARGPASGYELRRIFQSTPLATYSDSPGAVYPALRRLERRGFATPRAASGARRRQPWQLTAAGRAWLQRWIQRSVTVEAVAGDVSAVDLQLALISTVTPDRLRPFLGEYAAAVENHLESLTASTAKLAGVLPPSAARALDLGVHLFRARSAWCHRAARELA